MEKKISELKCKMVTCSALTQFKLNAAFDEGMDMVIDKRKARMATHKKKEESAIDCQII
jgi:hypothetical protein